MGRRRRVWSEVAWNTKASNLVSAYLVRLAIGWKPDNPGRERGNEAPGDRRPSGSSSLVAVQQQNDFMKVLSEKMFLVPRQRAPHQGHDAWKPCLMHLEAVKEAFHNDDGPAVLNGPVKVKEHERLSEECRELVLRRRVNECSAGVGDQDAVLIMNRDHNPALHRSFTGKEANREVSRCFWANATFGQVGVREVDAFESKRQRLVPIRAD